MLNKLFICLLFFGIIGCGDIKEYDKQLSLFKEEKVEIETWKYQTINNPVIFVRNKNNFEISVKCVVQSMSHGEGENTLWFKKIPSNSEVHFCHDSRSINTLAYYIYSGSELISFIRAKYPIVEVRISKIENRED